MGRRKYGLRVFVLVTVAIVTVLVACCGREKRDEAGAGNVAKEQGSDTAGRRAGLSARDKGTAVKARQAKTCSACNGSGVVSKTCPYCSGKGYQGTSRNPQTCIVCKGTGVISEKCPSCKGTGFLSSQ